jgi:hypothetical protein
MHCSGAPQPQSVCCGSCRISRRGKRAGSAALFRVLYDSADRVGTLARSRSSCASTAAISASIARRAGPLLGPEPLAAAPVLLALELRDLEGELVDFAVARDGLASCPGIELD